MLNSTQEGGQGFAHSRRLHAYLCVISDAPLRSTFPMVGVPT